MKITMPAKIHGYAPGSTVEIERDVEADRFGVAELTFKRSDGERHSTFSVNAKDLIKALELVAVNP